MSQFAQGVAGRHAMGERTPQFTSAQRRTLCCTVAACRVKAPIGSTQTARMTCSCAASSCHSEPSRDGPTVCAKLFLKRLAGMAEAKIIRAGDDARLSGSICP
jgi:hypothetical protein